jgi:hypothetical protein
MRTGTSVASLTVPDPDDFAVDLVAQVHNHCRRVIEGELQRLSGRVPTLGPADLAVIGAALEDVAESLILDRLRNAPQHTAPLLWRLFGSPAEDR